MSTKLNTINSVNRNWMPLVTLTFLAAFAYTFIEWFFNVTKPSFLDVLGFGKKFEILLFTISLFATVCFLLLLIPIAASFLFRSSRIYAALFRISILLPAGITASLCLLMVDNFTYTLFKFGVVSTSGFVRGVYAVLFTAAVFLIYRSFLRLLEKDVSRVAQKTRVKNIYYGSIAVVIAPALYLLASQGAKSAGSYFPVLENDANLPHIVLLTSDGLNASNMSVYGYARETTPNIRELSETSLIAENAFSNSGHTSGSIVSLLTGKYPINTRVLYPPDILHGSDSYQHLPAILRSNGYFSVQLGSPYFVDSHSRNMLEAFDVTNGYNTTSDLLTRITNYVSNDLAYFIYDMGNRIADRLRHIFFIKTMTNPIDAVNLKIDDIGDLDKYQKLRELLDTTERPLFVHAHFMGTHGAQFYSPNQVFSAGQDFETQGDWNVDFYDDSILQFDRYVGQVIEDLRNQGIFKNTILIIGSDHGQKYITTERIPLIIHFPGGSFAGKITSNVQNLDIAPTLLDYLGIEKPFWMEGNSLIQGDPGQRPIFGVDALNKIKQLEENGVTVLNQQLVSPPFFQFSNITVTYCQNWYKLDLVNYEWRSGEVSGSTSHCNPTEVVTKEQAYQWIKDHLEEYGFDLSSLQ